MKRYIPDWANTTKKAPRTRVFGMLTPFSRLKLVGELYLNGWSVSAITAYTGIARTTISLFIDRAGLKRQKRVVALGSTWQPLTRMRSVMRGKRP